MKVLYFHQHFSTPSGATGIRSYEMARKLINRGHEVVMVCGSYHGGNSGLEGPYESGMRRGMVDGIDVIEFELPYSNQQSFMQRTALFLRFALSSIRVALREPYDLVFATTTPLTAGIPGIVARWLRRKPFVFEVRDLWPELPKAMGVITNPAILGAMSILEWVSYRSATRCIGLSPGIVDGIVRRGVSRDKVTLISNGCDIEIFQGVEAKRDPRCGKTDLVAVYTGTHGIANGVDAAVSAATELKRRGRDDIKLCFIGSGKLKPALLEQAKEQGLNNCVFLDPVPKPELARYLKGADLGMQLLMNVPAFYFGTSPNKFFDYISAGLPVLNNYPGWVAGMVSDNDCGYVVDPDDPEAFADALEAAADDRSSLAPMGKRGHQLALEEFNRENLSNRFVDWLEAAAK